jgi:hypothetical protein
MNKNNEEEVSSGPVGTAIAEALLKLKGGIQKGGVDLLEITKKLSSKKFGKSRH